MKSLNLFTSVLLIVAMQNLSFGTTSSTSGIESNFGSNGNNCLIAVNDTFHFVIGCGDQNYTGSVLHNDIIPEGVTAKIQQVCSGVSSLSFGTTGNFVFNASVGYNGVICFKYRICDSKDEENLSEATVTLFIESDFDCDEIFDEVDLDDDNDGLLDSIEGNGTVDSDNDGIYDVFDIDDDNDGIPDNFEWQQNDCYLAPSGIDANRNGWDDVYESKVKSGKLKIADTDVDGIPDFRDTDSDNDSIPDMVEAYDINFDMISETFPILADKDNDGLDDSFDTVLFWRSACNSTGSKATFPDQNNNGIQDYRETKTIDLVKEDEVEVEVEVDISYFDPEIKMYPNPSNGMFIVNIPNYSNDEEVFIRIYSTNGKLLQQLVVDSSIVNINMNGYRQGLYLVKINSTEINWTQKMVIQS